MNSQRRQALKILSGVCGSAVLPRFALAAAEPYPTEPVNVVVPNGAGLSTDYIARLLVSDVSERHNGKFFVENKAGAAGNIGTRYVATAKPDGTTLLYATATPFVINPFVYRKLPYDSDKDFLAVSRTVQLPLVLVVSKELGINSLGEFVEYLKKNQQASSFSSYGVGTSSHIAGAIFCKKIGAPSVLHVPYKDMKAMPDLAAGRNTFHIDAWNTVAPLVKAGKLVALAVSSNEQLPWVPDLPTISGFIKDDYELVTWHAVFAPKGTPVAILDFLNQEFKQSIEKESIRQAFAEQGFLAYPYATRDEVEAFIDQDKKRWQGFVKDAGVEPI